MREFLVTLRIKTEDGDPYKWDWQDLIDDEVELVKHEEILKSVKVKLSGIEWDAKDQQFIGELPTELIVEVTELDDHNDDEIFQMAVDQASDMIGFCIRKIENEEILG